MDLLSEIYEKYKERAEQREDISSIPVLWGPFLEMLEETINSATLQVFGEWPYEHRMELAEPTLWVKEFFKKSRSKDKSIGHLNDSSLYKRRTALMNMFEYRNYEAHYNPEDAPTRGEIRKLEKQIGEFVEGLRIHDKFFGTVNQIIHGDARQRHFKATPYSIGAHFKSVICSVSIKHTWLQNNHDMKWVDYCLSRATVDLIAEYSLDLTETDVIKRFNQALEEIEQDFQLRIEDTPLFKEQLFTLSKVLTKTLKNIYKENFNSTARGLFDKHKVIKRFQQWKKNFEVISTKEHGINIFHVQIATCLKTNDIEVYGLSYISRENPTNKPKRIEVKRFTIADPKAHFVDDITDFINETLEEKNTPIEKPDKKSAILLIEVDNVACEKKIFSALYKWGNLLSPQDRFLDFAGVFTVLTKYKGKRKEYMSWYQESNGVYLRKLRGKRNNIKTALTTNNLLHTIKENEEEWRQLWRKDEFNIFLVEEDTDIFRRCLLNYDVHKSGIIISNKSTINKIQQILLERTEISLIEFLLLIGKENRQSSGNNSKYTVGLFSYKEWEPQAPFGRMPKR